MFNDDHAKFVDLDRTPTPTSAASPNTTDAASDPATVILPDATGEGPSSLPKAA